MNRILVLLLSLTVIFSASTMTLAQDAPEKPAAEEKKPAEKGSEEEKEKPKFKPFDKVITEDAETKEGVFTTHLIDGKLYYEIPADQLDREFLWVTQFSKTQTGMGFGGMPIGSSVMRWERRGDDILLREIDYTKRAQPGTPIEVAVEASSLDKIVATLKIVTFKDEEKTIPVVDVSKVFLNDIAEFSPKQSIDAAAILKDRTFIQSVKPFPRNIEVRVLATYKLKPGKGRLSNRPANATVELHHSMVALPEDKMHPRIFDYRIGYFSGSFEDYSSTDDELEEVTYISRYRLEKKDPEAELSEPVKPIVYYIGRGVPERYREYVRQGIEMWQPAFEQAGFKNAIIAKEPPSAEEDPDWDAEDARYSVIRWLPSDIPNAFGPHIRDPRTGEILEADVRMFHNVIRIARDWYFIRAGASDPRASKLPLPEDLQGELIRYVVAHEVGHTLGLRHNHKSNAGYTVEQLRDPEFTAKYGYMGSIMDYSRFNYVAQPGDGALLGVDFVFPYDKFAIEWGYSQFAGTTSPKEDKPYLDEIAARQQEDPKLIYGSYEEGSVGRADPFSNASDQTGEPIKASDMGVKNLQRIMGYLLEATTEEGEDYSLLKHMHQQAYRQYITYMYNVAKMVGSIEYDKKVAGQQGAVFSPFSAERQRQAVAYLNEHAFHVKPWLLPADITSLVGMEGITATIGAAQDGLFARVLLNDTVLGRMLDVEALEPGEAYPAAEYLSDLTAGIFAEFKDAEPAVEIFRRGLQMRYVERLAGKLENDKLRGDIKALAHGVLLEIYEMLENIEPADVATGYHANHLKSAIKSALDDD